MALVVPNAGDSTGSSSRYATLDQSEPDSVDFEILSNAGRSGVLSGCAVTGTNSADTVTVESGRIIVNGVSYSVSGGLVALPAGPTSLDDPTYRFDLVVARVINGSASVIIKQGFADNGGIRFPRTRNTAVTFSSATDLDLTTDVVLASLYRNLSSPIGQTEVVDKRVMLSSAIYDVGASDPLSTDGSTGSVFFRNNRAQGSSGSGVYVKNSTGSWLELAQNNGPQVPIGAVVAWASTATVPTGWLECNGASLSRTGLYADLFAVIGTQFGAPSATEFSLPNLNDKFLRGTTTANSVGTTGGADSQVVPVPYHRHTHDHSHGMIHYHGVDHGHNASANANSDLHSHGYSHRHTGGTNNQSVDHSHGMGHNHNAGTTSSGQHWHGAWFDEVGAAPADTGHNYHAARPQYWARIHWKHEGTENDVEGLMRERITTNYYNASYSGTTGAPNYADDGDHGHTISVGNSNSSNTGGVNASHSHTYTTNTGISANSNAASNNTGTQSANHSHGVSVLGTGNTLVGKRPLANASNTSANKDSTDTLTTAASYTSYEGTSGVTIPTVPAFSYFRWIIRAQGTLTVAASDGDNILSEAREEVVTLELDSGAVSTGTGKAYYRLPWAATLTAVKANCNGGASSEIQIDVNEDGTSVLSTVLTIDNGATTSLTATTPAVISDSAIANDALITVDVDAGSGTGPLTVTLYFTRED